MDGGLGGGQLGVIVGAAGGGKTWALVALGSQAMLRGKNVVHYTLELSKPVISMRYDSYLSKIPFNTVRHRKAQVKQKLDQLEHGFLIVQQYSTKEASVSTLRLHLKKLIARGKKPDIIILDYADLLDIVMARGLENSYFAIGQIYIQLRQLAAQLDIPV